MNFELEIWRKASRVSIAVAVLSIALSSWLYGVEGFWGSLIGSGVVVIFFGIHLAVSFLARDLDPNMTMALVMLSYFAKVVGLAIFLIVFRRAGFVNQDAFAISAICVTAAWLAAEVRAFVKLRLLLIRDEH